MIQKTAESRRPSSTSTPCSRSYLVRARLRVRVRARVRVRIRVRVRVRVRARVRGRARDRVRVQVVRVEGDVSGLSGEELARVHLVGVRVRVRG